MSINLNSRNNTLCCKVNDLYTALMASELLNDCVDDVVVMLKTCVDYVNIVSSRKSRYSTRVSRWTVRSFDSTSWNSTVIAVRCTKG